ncbi:vWA domain-containing protein [Brevibacterium casei]|uniref:von Willebrand factor type A domain-containing protein n=1 Tax=Brevibacterium casei CIP 102111 TaxID=1255625 RepID=A0A2H1KIA8_9MICO|nr:VWA domain-containing protein [Brevibacterium casei]MCT2359491.1 VWA domain-containing protein [Brevibacterium casei]QPR37999.1 VWA domain-containing protein [Brevibacterium casei]QPR45290.1 VWA domain-containing protein [Brevibacterium casei]QZE25037.1 VWA domain-containing protein [Brevibacterium casei]SMX99485.1 von Willebrand factor type A domain-containing protein [Brevibacterium casei CIP 102111]
MVLMFWWLALALLVLAALAVVVFRRPRRTVSSLPVAHSARMTSLPGFRRAMRRKMTLTAAFLGVIALTGLGALAGVARPAWIETVNPEKKLRDVMLCLDVSGSMLGYDADLLAAYQELVERFDGERIGMTVFNATAVSAFPLTDDYDMVQNYLEDAEQGFRTWGSEGTDYSWSTSPPNIGGSSLIGDGLVSCIDNFDRKDEDRSRSIVFATDNMLAGEPLFELNEAADIAVEANVRIYSLSPPSILATTQTQELRSVSDRTGGKQFDMGSATTIDRIVSEIQSQEAENTPGRSYTIVHDMPAAPLLIAAFGLIGVFVLAWRVRS